MILKEYQKRTLVTVRSFFQQLAEWREEDRAARSQNPDWGFDWVQRAWEKSVAGRRYPPPPQRTRRESARLLPEDPDGGWQDTTRHPGD